MCGAPIPALRKDCRDTGAGPCATEAVRQKYSKLCRDARTRLILQHTWTQYVLEEDSRIRPSRCCGQRQWGFSLSFEHQFPVFDESEIENGSRRDQCVQFVGPFDSCRLEFNLH